LPGQQQFRNNPSSARSPPSQEEAFSKLNCRLLSLNIHLLYSLKPRERARLGPIPPNRHLRLSPHPLPSTHATRDLPTPSPDPLSTPSLPSSILPTIHLLPSYPNGRSLVSLPFRPSLFPFDDALALSPKPHPDPTPLNPRLPRPSSPSLPHSSLARRDRHPFSRIRFSIQPPALLSRRHPSPDRDAPFRRVRL
jgi:hypothetical protein